MDIEEEYQIKAEELAIELYNREYEELSEAIRDIV